MSSVAGALEGDGSSKSSSGPSLSGSVNEAIGGRGVSGDESVEDTVDDEGSVTDASNRYAARSSVRSSVAAGAGREKMGRLIRL